MTRPNSVVAAKRLLRVSTWSLVPLAASLAVVVILIALARVREARTQAEESDATHARLVQEAAELRDLQANADGPSLGQRPAQDTLAQISSIMDAAGLSPGRIKDLASESDGPLPGSNRTSERLQTMRLTLESVRPSELAMLLDRWRTPRNPWVITRLELSHAGPPDDQSDQYNAKLIIAAPYRLDNQSPIEPPIARR